MGLKELLFMATISLVALTLNESYKEEIDHNKVESIRFVYLPKDIMPQNSIQTFESILDFYPDFVKDTTFTDVMIIEEYCEQLNKLKPSDEPKYYDFRIISIIKFRNKKETLKLGFDQFMYYILLDNKKMEGDSTLVKYLDKLLYDGVPDWEPEIESVSD